MKNSPLHGNEGKGLGVGQADPIRAHSDLSQTAALAGAASWFGKRKNAALEHCNEVQNCERSVELTRQ